VLVATLPDRSLGFAVRIDDGAKRASETAMAALISQFPDPNSHAYAVLEHDVKRQVRNAAGDSVGVIRAADGWFSPYP